jgi:type VI secretion system secreted protein Hcp
MAVDMFIKIKDIKGESTDKVHKEDIDVLAWSWGLSQSGTTHTSTGGGAGKVNVQDLSITKYVDKSTTVLTNACSTGKHIPEAILFIRKAGDKPLEYIKITMTDCIVTSISQGGSSGGDERFTETVTLNFGKYKYEYTAQKKDGSAEPTQTFVYNIAQNTVEG